MAELFIEGLNSMGDINTLKTEEVEDNISIDDVKHMLNDLINNSKDKQGVEDTLVLFNSYLIIELGPREATILWDKLFDKSGNDVTHLFRK